MKNHEGKFLFTINDFVSFRKKCQSMYFMSPIFLKENIDGVRVPPFQPAYILYTTRHLHKYLVKLCSEVHYMWWGNQYLYLQEWGYCINSNKTIILYIIVLVPKNNPQG